MKTTQTLTYPASPDAVAAMLADAAYQRGRVERLQPEGLTCDVSQDGQAFTATTRGQVPPSRLPSAARRLVRSTVSVEVTEAWGAPEADGSRAGRLRVAVGGAPVTVAGTTRLEPCPEGTRLVLDLDLRVTVPLVGRAIEEKAVSLAGHAVADEERRATAYLAQHT